MEEEYYENAYKEICPKCGKPRTKLPVKKIITGSPVGYSISFCDCYKPEIKLEGIENYDIFTECLFIAYREFCLNRLLHKKIKTNLYKKFKKEWDLILVSIELSYILWIAKILEYKILKKYKFNEEHKSTKDKIENWRNEFIAHLNTKTLNNYKDFVERNKISAESTRSLFYKIADIFDSRKEMNFNLREEFNKI